MNFWNAGLYRLTLPQIADLLRDSVMEVSEDNEILRKFIDREIKPFFK